ncbi:hypothetical protein Tsubulata_020900 [Turnera subulata]|uniref:Uncharacterized protein n=1 Tax=Turnera subulata TaxID=218843 RepID=A0A9Q0FQP8_9ROSI|nr:hypothetical protein Tsubulata_020900 [Turnera subulata]
MRSLNHIHHPHLPRLRVAGFPRPRYRSSVHFPRPFHRLKLNSPIGKRGRGRRFSQRSSFQIKAFDDGDFDFDASTFDEWGDTSGAGAYVLSSSDGDDSDRDFSLNPVSDIDLPTSKVQNHDALTMSAHRLGLIGRGRKKRGQVANVCSPFF